MNDFMKKPNTSSKTNTKITIGWKQKREMLTNSISLEVDLENRQLFFEPGIEKKIGLDFGTNNVDNLIKTYLEAEDLKSVSHSLSEAKKGLEKPIHFSFTHPLTSKSFRFEYRYQIVYVKYASTRLHGELVKINAVKPTK